MATFKFEGVDELLAQYEKLERDSHEMIGKAVYSGADTVMGYVRAAVEGIATDDRHATPENKAIGPTTYAKNGLIQSLGITKARYDGMFYNVKIGFDGYNGVKTKTWPQGQPNSMIARAVQSGTSWMEKQPFLREAEQAARKPCEAAMEEVINKRIKEVFQ